MNTKNPNGNPNDDEKFPVEARLLLLENEMRTLKRQIVNMSRDFYSEYNKQFSGYSTETIKQAERKESGDEVIALRDLILSLNKCEISKAEAECLAEDLIQEGYRRTTV